MTRELNKKKREEEQRKKADEKAKKAAQRQAEKEKKEMEKAAKQAEKTAKQRTKKSQTAAGSTNESRKRPATTDDPGHYRSMRQKAPRLSSPEHINPNQCCTCFGLFEDDVGIGSEWLQCSCTRWIHEDCVEDVVCGDNGKEKLCPLCLAAV